jgi:hypothetical protein
MLPLKGVRNATMAPIGLCEDARSAARGQWWSAAAILAIRPEYISIAREAAAGENGMRQPRRFDLSGCRGRARPDDAARRQGDGIGAERGRRRRAQQRQFRWLTWPAEKGSSFRTEDTQATDPWVGHFESRSRFALTLDDNEKGNCHERPKNTIASLSARAARGEISRRHFTQLAALVLAGTPMLLRSSGALPAKERCW